MADEALIEGLLHVLERELLPEIERAEPQAWGRANRLADAVLALLSDRERALVDLPSQSVGALQSLYLAARASRSDVVARSAAVFTLTTRVREATNADAAPVSRRTVGARSLPVIDVPARGFPSWVPEGGVVGGFRLIRGMASGGLGSLFLARRLEDEGRSLARDVVLKVPHDPAALLVNVAEEDLLAQFRAEASVLAAIPPHPNLARIEAFDVGAHPKPFLVMELVEGPMLEDVLKARQLDMPRALDVLDGVLAGLETMHATGVGHLDIKPDNVILRRSTGAATLVDFGLSGRTVRKRCGNPLYAAPEVWNDDRESESPFAADAYSFACLAFETLTCRPLFDAEDALSAVRLHFTHDGLPGPLLELRSRPELCKLTEVLSRALRANPAQRTRIRMLRTELSRVVPALRDLSWPLVASGRASIPDVGRSSGPDSGRVSVPDVEPEASGRQSVVERKDFERLERETG